MRIHGTTAARPAELFALEEQPRLLPAPTGAYDLPIYATAKVHRDHVKVGKALYSVPWRHIGARVDARATERVVEVFVGTALVKTHPRVERGRQTDWDDYPPEKIFMRTPMWCRKKAAELGGHVEAVVCGLLVDGTLHHLRAAQGIIGLAERHSAERLDAACAQAVAVGDTREISARQH